MLENFRAGLKSALRRLTHRTDEFEATNYKLDKLGYEVRKSRAELVAAIAELRAQLPDPEEMRRLRRDVKKLREFVAISERTNYSQITSYHELRSRLPGSHPLPLLRSWAASPDFMILLMDLLDEFRPVSILEFGSGATSLVSARHAERVGGCVCSFDHEPLYAARTQRLVDEWGHGSRFELFTVDLVDIGQAKFYDRSRLDQSSKFDFVILDGPPAAFGKTVRGTLLPAWRDLLTDNCMILLDDYRRPDEREIVRTWTDMGYVELIGEYDYLEKQAALVRIRK